MARKGVSVPLGRPGELVSFRDSIDLLAVEAESKIRLLCVQKGFLHKSQSCKQPESGT